MTNTQSYSFNKKKSRSRVTTKPKNAKSNIIDRMVMAEIGGPLAHQLPLHNHRGGLVQPSLVMNHHLDLDCHGGGGGTELHPSK